MNKRVAATCRQLAGFWFLLAGASMGTTAWANTPLNWQPCAELSNASARLACFDQWAAQQSTPPAVQTSPRLAWPVVSTPAKSLPSATVQAFEGLGNGQKKGHGIIQPTTNCRASHSGGFVRFWELDADSDCGVFTIRGYKPINLSWIGANSVNTQPSSPSPGHTAVDAVAYDHNETRIQLSVRTKIAQGLLTGNDKTRRDALWFAYSQQSYWQVFNGDISRPFRSTDHEPELMYVYPANWSLGNHWRMAYAGLGLNHQSNGQSRPLSRSWNRNMLMAGFENDSGVYLQARLWRRLSEDAANDDNPDISNLVGRGEFSAFWAADTRNTWGLTLRHALRSPANGSARLEWLRSLGDSAKGGVNNGLRLHTQLFTGYGDSLLDYNRRRTVLSIGLSLVDW